jgi:LPXTG-motif cell wall-anchored protein
MFRAVFAAGTAGAAAAWPLLIASPVTATGAPPSAHVSMKEFAFMPATITVQAGQAVTWTYDESASDPMPNCESPYFQPPSPERCGGHSTTASDTGPDGKPLWNSGVHRADGFPFTHVFTKPGTYHYYCILHGGPNPNQPVTHMEGDIVVTAASGSAGAATPGASPAPSSSGGAVTPAAAAALPNTSSSDDRAGALGAGLALLAAALLLLFRQRRVVRVP